MSLLYFLSYVGIIAGLAFVVLSLASGLLWISEVIEEHSTLAKVIGIRTIYVIIALQILLYFLDSLPIQHTLFSILCYIVYLQNFSVSWPLISLSSLSFISSCILSIANHFVWFFYFSHRSHEARQRSQRKFGAPSDGAPPPGFAEVATFFAICVWLVPLFLFLSLSANDNTLPVSQGTTTSPTTNVTPVTPVSTTRTSLFKSILDVFPRFRRSTRAQGIIVTHTPNPSAPSTPYVSSFVQGALYPVGGNDMPISPRRSSTSASDDALSLGMGISHAPDWQLRPPPKRHSTGPTQRVKSSNPMRATEEQTGHTSLRIPSLHEDSPATIRRRATPDL